MRQFESSLITGADDDDPSGIATYSQPGAQFGFSILLRAVLVGGDQWCDHHADHGLTMLLAARRDTMGDHVIGPRLRWLG